MKRLYNHYFPTPGYLAMKTCAIDISDQSVKYGELIATSNGLRLGKYGKEKIPDGVVVSGKIEIEGELVKVLKKIKEKEGLQFVRASISEEQMYLFNLAIPKSANEKLRDMILLQIEEYIPLRATDAVFDYDIISEDKQNIYVEVVAIASAIIDGYMSAFKKSDLIPVSFEIESQAIARAVIPVGDDSPIMIVDLGESRTGLSISFHGRVFLTTTISLGGIDLTNMIAKNFSLSFEEAEKMKQEYGLDKVSKAVDLFPAILNEISVLRDELNKQYTYWETHNEFNKNHEKINHIILCGGEANLAGLSDYLEMTMKIKVDNANVWTNILNIEESIPNMSLEESLSYATVLGLELGGYIYNSQPLINLLPFSEKKIRHKDYWMRFFTMLLHLISIIGVVATLLLFPSYFLSKSEESLITDRIETFNKENPNLTNEDMDKTIGQINSKLNFLNNKTTPYQVNEKVFDNILSSRTSGITFSQILFNRNVSEESSLEVHGIASSRDALSNFKTELEKNPNFSKVELPISNFLEKFDLPFTISITIK